MQVSTETTFEGLRVTAWKHPSHHPQFKNGIFYGQVEGYDCTAPHFRPESAVEDALGKITNGGLACTLLTSIGCMEDWIREGWGAPDTQDQIDRARALLRRVLPLVENLEERFFAEKARAVAGKAD